MEKLVVIFITLFISFSVSAEHHREKIKQELASANIFIDGTRANLDLYFSDFGTMTAKEASNANAIYTHLYTVERRIDHLIAAMDYWGLDFETERRNINQPNYDVGPHSAMRRLATMIY